MQSGWTERSTTVLALITCALALLISKSHVHPALQLSQRILWLIAHRVLPLLRVRRMKANKACFFLADDEAFFFTPSINTLLRNSSTEGYILSLSTGSLYFETSRKFELMYHCRKRSRPGSNPLKGAHSIM